MSYELAYGPVPAGLEVCHSCDNRKCVNPAHLRADTRKANMQDAVERKQLNQGTKHGNSKLTNVDVLKILELRALGMLQREIGAVMGVSQTNVGRICRGRAWQHITVKAASERSQAA